MTDTKLIVLRGPSGSGKSTTAKALRLAQTESMAVIEQDYVRRIVLKEKDVPNGLNAELIKQMVFFAFSHAYHVVLEGIFDAERYEKMFQDIVKGHPSNNYFYYFDIPFEVTLERHQGKPNKHEFGEKEMRAWYKPKDFLVCAQEVLIPELNTLQQTVEMIVADVGLIAA